MIGIGVIGYGYWGPNLVRNFSEARNAKVVAVSDLRAERLEQVPVRYPSVSTTTDCRVLIEHPDVNAVVISTPVSTHFELAMMALQAGKHVFVEKPITSNAIEAQTLIEEADRRGLVLMVDHTFVYTGAVRKIHELVHSGELGELYYYDSMRVNLGLFQHDVDVLWDLAVHDLAIMDFVLPGKPYAVSATGSSHVPGKPENIAFLTLFFADGMIGHVNVNWLAPVKVRQTLIGGSRKMIVYDDLEPSEKIKVYDKGITMHDGNEDVYKLLIGYRSGDMWAPRLDVVEALQLEANEFIRSITDGLRPTTDGRAGLRVVRILEAATMSLAQRGAMVQIEGSVPNPPTMQVVEHGSE